MKTSRFIEDIRRTLEPLRASGTVGLVPTMGALHEGHVALFRAARPECRCLVASLFVNPTQFNDPADLAAYPRDEAHDARVAREAGVDILFAPGVDEMYPPGYATSVEIQGAARGFESDFRPGHFQAVAAVCLKLFTIVRPQLAFFGQKDAQQVAVVRQLVRDFNLEVDVRVVPTVRDRDGLALSSRNARLTPAQRVQALAIPRALSAGLEAHRAGADPVAAARAALAGLHTDYVAVADLEGRPTLLIGARVGATRLIDNVPLDEATLVVGVPPVEVTHAS